MMRGMPLETCWAFNEQWNNKFHYKVASCWLFLLSHTTVHGSMNIKLITFLKQLGLLTSSLYFFLHHISILFNCGPIFHLNILLLIYILALGYLQFNTISNGMLQLKQKDVFDHGIPWRRWNEHVRSEEVNCLLGWVKTYFNREYETLYHLYWPQICLIQCELQSILQR
jgi:hypothetical protein